MAKINLAANYYSILISNYTQSIGRFYTRPYRPNIFSF